MGVKDSKLLSPDMRTMLAPKLRMLASESHVVEAQPKEIDKVVLRGGKLRKLNFLEAQLMAQVISELAPKEAYVDASDVNEERYGETIQEFCPRSYKESKFL